MSLAPQELENTASKYASEAIKFDSQGARGMAITHYQHAIDALVKLLQLYPTSKLNQIYKERCTSYHNRINALQQAHGVEPAVDPKASDSEQKASVKRQESENDFEDLIMKEKPDVTWSQVIGLEDAKSALRESIIYPTKRPDLFPLGWPKGMLLYGPPGTGKTMLAAATANEMDGVNGKGKDLMLYVIGATNKPWSLDWPFLRRFQKRIYVSLPSIESRTSLFKQYTAPLRKDYKVNPVDLAKLFDGYSASDIKDICQAAQIKTVHEIFNAPDYHEPIEGEKPVQPRELTTMDFKDIMNRRKPSVSLEMIRAYHKWSEEFKAL
jgi:SpoVK/Ycf46/Vps4 family AAA+-type ATPase